MLLLLNLCQETSGLIQFEASLKWKQSLPQQPILDSWIINNSSSTSTQIPCSWRGITCDSKGTVTILNLAYTGLQGIVLAEEQKRLKEDGENLTTKARELGEHNLGLQNQMSEPEMKSKEREEELSVIMKKTHQSHHVISVVLNLDFAGNVAAFSITKELIQLMVAIATSCAK